MAKSKSDKALRGSKGGAAPVGTAPELLVILLQARDDARSAGGEPREFAVELRDLDAAGCRRTDLRGLVAEGHVEHLKERQAAKSAARSFRGNKGLGFSSGSCFVLTESGVAQAEKWAGGRDGAKVPRWDRDTLWLGDVAVGQWQQVAPMVRAVLTEFEKQGWPVRIENAITGPHAKKRRRDAVNHLNDVTGRWIRFSCDGTGEGIRWEAVKRRKRTAPRQRE